MASCVFASIVTMVTLLTVFVRCEEIRNCTAPQGRCIPLINCPEVHRLTIKQPMHPSNFQKIITRAGACGSNLQSKNLLVCCDILEEKINTPSPEGLPSTNSLMPAQCGRRPLVAEKFGGPVDNDNLHGWAVFLEISRRRSRIITGRCVGTMINDRYVLTAAHCLHHFDIEDVTMYFGLFKRSELESCLNEGTCQERKAAEFIIHEEYHQNEKLNDVALILTKDPVEINDFVAPICLPLNHTFEESGDNFVFTVGWGIVIGEKLSDAKRVARLRVIPQDECEKSMRYNSTEPISVLCILGALPGQDVCQADSGAPLLQYHNRLMYVVGVVIHGPRCGVSTDLPGRAMRVSHYMNWILTIIARSEA